MAVRGQRVAFVREPVELRGREPRALHELELARDVRAEADEVQAALADRAVARERLRRRQPHPVLAAAPQQPVEARRRDQVVVHAHRASKPEHADEPLPQAVRAGRQVGVARVRAAHVRAERATHAVRVAAIRERVAVGAPARRRVAVDRLAGRADERRAVERAPDHRLGPAQPARRVAAGARVEGSARSRGRPVAAAAARDSCRCGRRRRAAGRPRRAAAARAGRAPDRRVAGPRSRRIRRGSRAGTRRGRRGCRSRGASCPRPAARGPSRASAARRRPRSRTARRRRSPRCRDTRPRRSRRRTTHAARRATRRTPPRCRRPASRRAAGDRRRPIATRPDRSGRRRRAGASARRRRRARRRTPARSRRRRPRRRRARAARRS